MHAVKANPHRGGRAPSAFRRLALLAVVSLFATPSPAASLDPAVLPKIQAATFEVVAAKPVDDPLTYEKPLPLERLPFQQRNDKYYSIGTAFALGHNRYVTAAHVLSVGQNSLWGEPALRDASGHVYAIDQIEKYSMQQDFVVFSLAEQPAKVSALAINPKPALNSVVYAVGNALGTGVVIRDGLYTSNTPEQQDGRWDWMRFSAAASPGNSGGPLLDHNGKLIGIVLMKSANENLNYALPISEVLAAPDGLAVADVRAAYQLDLFDTPQNGDFKATFKLPLTLAAFYREYGKHVDAYGQAQLKALLARESAKLFPSGEGSARLLYEQTRLSGFPSLITRGSNGQWARRGQSQQHFTLEGNGYVDVGSVGNNGLTHLRRPDGVDAGKFYGDPTVRMDLLARTGIFQRSVGGENIKITSLGKPRSHSVHTDRWQRPWQVEVWPLPYANALMVVYVLPVPDGCIMLDRIVGAANEHGARLDLDELSSFVYVTYEGTLAQWQQFLAEPTLQPAAFKDIHIDIDYGHRFSYASSRVAFSYTPKVQTIAPGNLMYLGFRYFLDHGQPVWDVASIRVWKTTDSQDLNSVNIQRFDQPPPGLEDDMTSRWNKLAQRQYPYNGAARLEDGLMKIDAVVAPAAAGDQPPAVLYTAYYGVEGAQPPAVMKSRLDLLKGTLHVLEHGASAPTGSLAQSAAACGPDCRKDSP